MFFIFGTPRSGTTLLAQCLSGHPDIVVPGETDFIVPLAFIYDRLPHSPELGRSIMARLITESTAFAGSLGEYLTKEKASELVQSARYHPAAILESIYAEIARAAGAKLAGDKSPNDLNFVRILVKVGALAPDTKILHIVRDIRDVMVSLSGTGWGEDLDLYFPRQWANQNLYLHALYQKETSRYLLVRYEDMVTSPKPMFGRICGFLGVEFQEGMLDRSKRHPRYRSTPHLASLYDPIFTTSIGVYKKRLSSATLSSYETQAHEALAAFGYTTADGAGEDK